MKLQSLRHVFTTTSVLIIAACSSGDGTDGTMQPIGSAGGTVIGAAGMTNVGSGGTSNIVNTNGGAPAATAGNAAVGMAGGTTIGPNMGGAGNVTPPMGGAAPMGMAGAAATNGGAGATMAGAGSGGSPNVQAGMYDVPRGMSEGCGKEAPAGDSPNSFNKHDIMVTGVDPQFVADHPPNGGQAPYTYDLRNYFVRLPQNYDPSIAYPVLFGGGGCGNTNGMSGQGGGFTVLGNDQDQAIMIGMSYTYSGGACFEDGYANTAEVPYFDAMIAEIKANYCVDQEKVFMAGYSSGAWESYTLGLARGGVIRGIATAAGGLRAERPPPSDIPFAALLLTGQGDGSNPIDGPTGSAAARDEILRRNGCMGTDTQVWQVFGGGDCVEYTGCPMEFPVVWCTPPGGHTDGGGDYKPAIWEFWSNLPPVP